jgi:hypothetical protein
MSRKVIRVNVTLEGEHAAKLARLAERTRVEEGTLARSLLAHALDEADPDPRSISELLDGISGAYERAQLGLEQARSGDTVDSASRTAFPRTRENESGDHSPRSSGFHYSAS